MEAVGKLPGAMAPSRPAPATRRARLLPRNLGAVVQDGLRERFLARAFAAVGPVDRLLDLGCATKPFEPLYRRYARKSVGIDLPSSRHDQGGVDVAADGLGLPFADGSFDAVLCTEVMEHVPEPRRLVEEIRRVLRPNGVAILTTPFLVSEHEAPYDYFRYTRYGLRSLAERSGLDVEGIEPFAGLCGVFLTFGVQIQLKAWETLRLARLWNPLVFAFVYLPQVAYLAAQPLARRSSALRKLEYAPKGFGLVARRVSRLPRQRGAAP